MRWSTRRPGPTSTARKATRRVRWRSTPRAPATWRAPRRRPGRGPSTSRPTTCSTEPSARRTSSPIPVGPQSVYGHTKLAGERAVAAAAPGRHTIVRSSWLFGAGGACFPATILRLASERDELKGGRRSGWLSDVHRSTGRGARRAGRPRRPARRDRARRRRRELLVVRVRARDRGRRRCAMRGEPVQHRGVPRPATRPAYSVLRSERGEAALVLPAWREGLARVPGTVVEVRAA